MHNTKCIIMKKLVFFLATLCVFWTTNAQKINLVKDINLSGSSNPYIWGIINNNAIFIADDGTNGYELWTTDGTTGGTQVLKNIYPGNPNGISSIISIAADNKVFFGGKTATHGNELWVTDGTTAGTKMLKDISVGTNDGLSLTNFAYLNGKVFFGATDATDGVELWMSDGTESGTQLVKDINPGPFSSNPQKLITALGKVFFTATDATNGTELWVTDGTTTGTKMIADLFVGTTSSNIGTMIEYNGKIYFSGRATNAISNELYSTDGTTISLVKDIDLLANQGSDPGDFKVINNKLFFNASEGTAGRELWITDGTETGTVLVKNINPGNAKSDSYYLGELNSKLLFSARDGSSGRELWVSDGTTAGTKILTDINVGSGDGVITTTSLNNFKNRTLYGGTNFYNGLFYFVGDDGTNGRELWCTDGTDTGTYMVEQVGVFPNNITSANLSYIYIDSNNVWLSMENGNDGKELYLYKAPIPPVVSVNEVAKNNQLTITPNPNNGSFTVQLPSSNFRNGYLSVKDITGKIVYDQSINPNSPQLYIPLPDLPAGTYIVSVLLDGSTSTQKTVLQ